MGHHDQELTAIGARLDRDLTRAELHVELDRLAELAAAGSGPALDCLLRAVMDRRLVEREVRSVLGHSAETEDTVQAALVAIGLNIGGFEGRAHFLTWMRAVATNEVRMTLRRRTRKSEPVDAALPETDPTDRRISSLIADQVRYDAALDRLQPDHRRVLVLREVEQLEYDEIASVLDLPIGTVRSRLHRARTAFISVLFAGGSEGGVAGA